MSLSINLLIQFLDIRWYQEIETETIGTQELLLPL